MTRLRLPLSPVSTALAFGVLVLVGSALIGRAYDLTSILGALNVWAALVTVRIMWHYHVTTDWQNNPVGRTTMGIKGVILMLVAVGVGRRTQEWAALHHHEWLRAVTDAATDTLLTTSWVLLAVVLTMRLRVIRDLQSTGDSEPEPPDRADQAL